MDEIGLEQARILATQALARDTRHELVISAVSEHEFGWVFEYAPKKYLETGDPNYLVPGSTPLVVTREGKVESLGSSRPQLGTTIAEYLEKWRRTHPPR